MARTVRFRAKHGIIVALDADTVDACKKTIDLTTTVDGVVGYKLGMTMALNLGLAEAVRQLRSHTVLPLLYDHQKAGPDVVDMAAKFAALCANAKVDGLILFPLAGPRAVEGFVGESLKQGILPLVGGDLPFPDFNISGGGYVADDALERGAEGGAVHRRETAPARRAIQPPESRPRDSSTRTGSTVARSRGSGFGSGQTR